MLAQSTCRKSALTGGSTEAERPRALPRTQGTEIFWGRMALFRSPFRDTGLRVNVPGEGLDGSGSGPSVTSVPRIHAVLHFRHGPFHHGRGGHLAQAGL